MPKNTVSRAGSLPRTSSIEDLVIEHLSWLTSTDNSSLIPLCVCHKSSDHEIHLNVPTFPSGEVRAT